MVDVQRVLLEHDAVVGEDVGVGEIDAEDGVVVAQVAAEQQRLHVVDEHFEARQEPRVAMVEPVAGPGRCADVAVRVDDEEAVAMLESAARPRDRDGRRDVGRTLGLVRGRQGGRERHFNRHARSNHRRP